MSKPTVRQVYRAIESQDFNRAIQLIGSSQKIRDNVGLLGGTDWLQYSAYYGYDELVLKLLDIGFDPNARAEQEGDQALALAASQGHVSTMKILLDAGAELDTSGSVRNPLIAATFGHYEAAKLLIEAGIDLFVAYGDDQKGTALVFALERGQAEIANLIADAMAHQSGRTKEELLAEAMPHIRSLEPQRILPTLDDIE